MIKQLNIFDFSDYRKYVARWLDEAKRARVSNLTRLAEVAKVHPTFLSHILSGTKHLSLEQAALISKYIEHTRLEREYFFTLIQLDRSGSQEVREYWLEKKKQIESEKNKLSKVFEKRHELTDEDRIIFYSNWMYVAIWACTAIDNGQSLEQIAHKFHLSREKAQEILSFLLKIGVCLETKGIYKMGTTHVHIGNESPLVTRHHSNWRMKGLQRMDMRQDGEVFFTAPMSIARKDFLEIGQKVHAMIKQAVEIAKASEPEDLFCLSIDFFQALD